MYCICPGTIMLAHKLCLPSMLYCNYISRSNIEPLLANVALVMRRMKTSISSQTHSHTTCYLSMHLFCHLNTVPFSTLTPQQRVACPSWTNSLYVEHIWTFTDSRSASQFRSWIGGNSSFILQLYYDCDWNSHLLISTGTRLATSSFLVAQVRQAVTYERSGARTTLLLVWGDFPCASYVQRTVVTWYRAAMALRMV